MGSDVAGSPDEVRRVLIWDWPVRVFHWTFALAIAGALTIALAGSEESPAFGWHAILGLTAAAVAALRVVWGFIGTRYARFSSFCYRPAEVVAYFAGVVTGRETRHQGHNPGSAVAIGLLLLLTFGLAATGWMLGQGNESVKRLHELLAWGILAVAGAHVLGVIAYSVRFRELLPAAMVDGRRLGSPRAAIDSPRAGAGGVFLAVAVGTLVVLAASRGPTGQELRLLGTTLQLGESEEGEGAQPPREFESEHDD